MKYQVELEGVIYSTVYVEADSVQEAEEKALLNPCENVDIRHEWNVFQTIEWDISE